MPRHQFFIDLDRCNGCRSCELACKAENGFRGVKVFTTGTKKCTFVPILLEECTLCKHRVDQGLEPACVITCIPKAIHFGDEAEITSRIAGSKKLISYGTNYL